MPSDANESRAFEHAIEEAAERLERASEKLRNEARSLLEQAAELSRRAQALRLKPTQHLGPDGTPRVSDWSRVNRATAMHEFMRQYPIGQKVQISEVVKALRQGGCNVAGKIRPGKTDGQKEAERNLFIAAHQNPKLYEYNKKTREIWRIT